MVQQALGIVTRSATATLSYHVEREEHGLWRPISRSTSDLALAREWCRGDDVVVRVRTETSVVE